MKDKPGQIRQRRTLALLAFLFLAPVAVAFYLYYGGWRIDGDVSHGNLITPARPLPDVSLSGSDGNQSPPVFKQKWSLIYVGDGRCNEECRRALYVMRQVRIALNQDMERVQRVFLYQGDCCEEPFFSTEHRGLVALDLDSGAGPELVSMFDSMQTPGDARSLVWVADPLGNLMMSYPADTDPKGMIEDLKKLLKLSHVG